MSEEIKCFYEFGAFRLDVREKILYRADVAVPLKPKAVETLIVLVEDAGNVVSKQCLMSAVWRETYVEENNLSVNIYELRKAFARFGAAEKYIETVPRRGFRFSAPVEKILAEKNVLTAEKSDAKISGENLATENAALPETPPIGETASNRNSENFKTKNTGWLPSQIHRQGLIAVLIIVVVVSGGGWLYARREQSRQTAKPDDAARIIQPERGTKSIEAYQLYLRGRELWQTRNNAKMAEGIEFFRRAIELDANFVAPYLGIADSLSMMRNDAEDWRRAEDYANKAIELAPASADAHATLGFIYAMNKWQWQTAENYFQKALAIDANNGKAHQWYATLLFVERRFDEAEKHLKRAIEIEPLSPNYNADLCELYLFTARDEQTFAQCRRTAEINPDFQYVFFEREIYIRQKRFDEAAEAWVKAIMRFGVPEEEARRGDWYRAFLKSGFRGWMLEDIENNKKNADTLLGVWNTSIAYAQLGDREKTLEYLEKSLAGHAFLLPYANVRPEFDFVRDDARFQNILRRVGLR